MPRMQVPCIVFAGIMNSEVEAVVQQIGQFEAMLNRDLAQDPTSESLKHDKTYLQGRLLGLQKQKNILRRRQGGCT